MSLTVQAVMALALQCAPSTPHPEQLAHVLTGIALQESRLDPAATHTNHNGSVDYGLLQVNSTHIGYPIGYRGHVVTAQSLLDPCESLAAGANVLLSALSAYNTGSPIKGIENGYAMRAIAAIDTVTGGQTADKSGAPQDRPLGVTLDDQILSFTRTTREIVRP